MRVDARQKAIKQETELKKVRVLGANKGQWDVKRDQRKLAVLKESQTRLCREYI